MPVQNCYCARTSRFAPEHQASQHRGGDVVVLDVGLSRFAVRAQPMFALRLERQATSPRSCTMLVQLPRRLLPMCTQFGVSPFAVPSGSSCTHSVQWLHHGPSVPLASRGYNTWYVCGGSVWQCLWSGYRGDAHTHLLLWPQVLAPTWSSLEAYEVYLWGAN